MKLLLSLDISASSSSRAEYNNPAPKLASIVAFKETGFVPRECYYHRYQAREEMDMQQHIHELGMKARQWAWLSMSSSASMAV